MNKIFGQDEFIVVSQEFHNQRALYIAQWAGLTAYGYNARGVGKYMGFMVDMREKLARVKMFLDLIVNRDPHFLGDKIELGS
jgi:SanA protein